LLWFVDDHLDMKSRALGSSDRDGEASGGGGRVASLSRKSISTLSSGNRSQITAGIERQSLQTDEQTILQRSAVERTRMKVDVTTGSSPLETIPSTEEYPNARRASKVDAQHHRSQTISSATLSSERMKPSSAALNSSASGAVHGTTAISLAEGFAIATEASALVVASDAGEKASARGSAQSTGRTSREQAVEDLQVSDSESVVILSNLTPSLMFCSRQTNTLPLVPSVRPSLQTREPVISHEQRTSSLEIKTQQESIEDVSGSRLPGRQRHVPVTAVPTKRSLATSHTQTTDRTSRKETIEDLQVSDSESVVILSSLVALLIFYCSQTHSLPRVPNVGPSVQTIEPVISYEQRVSSREIKTQQESIKDVSGRLPGGQRRVPLSAAPTTRSLTTSARGSDHTQTRDRTSREQAIEDFQVSDSESVVILSNLILSPMFCSRQTNILPLVPSARTSLQTKEQVTLHIQRVSSREVKTQLESVGDESGQTTSKSAQFTVGTEETHGSNELAMRKTSS
jgi:hypothetical protein